MTSTPAPEPTSIPCLGESWTLPTAGATPHTPAKTNLTPTQKKLVGIVVTGVVLIAAIGFVGSYAAVTALAVKKGFGWFAKAFPAGIDAGIVVFLALDLLLTWLRMPFPLLRQGAWALTAATIAFNAAASWPDPLAVGMHATIPILFILAVEAARHAIGRIADITADRHMESPRWSRWVLAPASTFRIWRRQRLWELRSYEEVITLERQAAKYRAKLRAKYGRSWRRKAQSHELMALRFARLGTPITDTLAEHEAELAAASERQNAAKSDRQEKPNPSVSGAGGSDKNDDSGRQDDRQQTGSGGAANASSTAKKPANTAGDSNRNAGGAGLGGDKKPRQKTAKKSPANASTRRAMAEWIELAGPIFHDQFRQLRRQPTAKEFKDAIANAGLGDVSESTAKNIRQAVLDNTPLPSLT